MNILSSTGPDYLADVGEPTDAELMAIEAEWPSIEADLIVLDTEITAQHRRCRRRARRILSVSAWTEVA